MTNDGNRTDSRDREREARDRAAHGQSLARGDTGDGETGVESSRQGVSNRRGDRGAAEGGEPREGDDAGPPPTQAGVPPVEHQERSSLDSPSQSGRPRDEGDDQVERSRNQAPRSDPEAVRPPGSPAPDDNTM
jgi:hypothetical protein